MTQSLLKDYFPFGTQYYRAPSPYPETWETDMKQMADLGFNMVKFWVQWRWNHPREDRFEFDDIDRLMDLAHKDHHYYYEEKSSQQGFQAEKHFL